MKISGRYFSLWSEDKEHLENIRTNIRSGDYVDFNYTEKENPNGGAPYKNIKMIKKGAATSTSAQIPAHGEDDLVKNRGEALRDAVEFSKTQAFHDALDEKKPATDLLFAVADACEAWLNRPFGQEKQGGE